MQPFIKKYRPKKISEIVSQESAINELKGFIQNFNKQKKKAVLVYGTPGTGKTSSVHAIANDLGLELVEVNASEFRNQEQINLKVGNAIKQRSLFGKEKLILIDEIDGIVGTEDRGGLQAVMRLIVETPYPIILTINDPWDFKYSSLRSKCNMIKFEPINYQYIETFLRKICAHEKISIDETALRALARKTGGDLMSALNDLQSIAERNLKINKEDVENISYRDRQESILTALLRIFKTTDLNIALGAFENVKEDLDAQLLWLDENLPKEYTIPEDLANAYDALSRADVFNRRIKRNQYYRFLVYINALITGGIALAKKEKYQKQVNYAPTGRLLKIFWANQKSLKKKEIAKKIAVRTHCSVRDAVKNVYYFKTIFKANKEMANNIAHELGLSEEEVEWLKR